MIAGQPSGRIERVIPVVLRPAVFAKDRCARVGARVSVNPSSDRTGWSSRWRLSEVHSSRTATGQEATSWVVNDLVMGTSPGDGITRRGVLTGAAVGVTAALVACGGDKPDSTGSRQSNPVTVNAADVPVGSAAIVGQVVVSQPAAGDFLAFSAVCTHQQCLVSQVRGDEIICTCHQTAYSAKDGSVISGPAPRPLASRTVTRSGESLTIT
jgi:Rieske Fe-S protein